MKLLTLNAHSWQETDNVSCLRHVAETLRQEQPDVVALQEINQRQGDPAAAEERLRKSGFVSAGDAILETNWALALAELVPGYAWSWVYTHVGYRSWEEGIAVMSRMPILEVRSRNLSSPDLPEDSWRHRRVLAIHTEAGWFCSTHTGWWDDEIDPFPNQWKRLNAFMQTLSGPRWLMGDFNSPAHERGRGYDLILSDGWEDCYARAENRDSGITVPGQIDGWRHEAVSGFRMDLCLAGQPGRTLRSNVIFNGDFHPVVSDHFGVLTEESVPSSE